MSSFRKGWPAPRTLTVFGQPRAGELRGPYRQKVLASLPPFCVHCNAEENLTVDHRLARVFGGTNASVNLQPLCQSCNNLKAEKEGRIADHVRQLLEARTHPLPVPTTFSLGELLQSKLRS